MTLNEILKAEVENLNVNEAKFLTEELLEVGCGLSLDSCGSGGSTDGGDE